MNLTELGLDFAFQVTSGINKTELNSDYGRIIIEKTKIETVVENDTETRNKFQEYYETEDCGTRFEVWGQDPHNKNKVSRSML